jgi:hypothetical protein
MLLPCEPATGSILIDFCLFSVIQDGLRRRIVIRPSTTPIIYTAGGRFAIGELRAAQQINVRAVMLPDTRSIRMTEAPQKTDGIVIKDYVTPHPEPIDFLHGEEVIISDRESEWPGWVWCTKSTGEKAWVPESILRKYDDTAEILTDYCSIELTVTEGEKLILLREEAGWFWCRAEDDREGWVPQENVRIE